MLFLRNGVLGVVLMVTACSATALGAESVVCPKVLPDRAVDTSGLDSIIQCVTKPGMSPQEKLLALYHFYRRMVYHHRYMGSDRREILRVINSYGVNLCGSQVGSFTMLLQKAGFRTRPCFAKVKGYGTHTFLEVEYDGAWHGFDTMTSFYVLNRKGQIASFAEIKADPTLVTQAVEEGRAPKEYGGCTREIEPEQKGVKQHCRRDRPWSLLRWSEGMTVPGFWEKAARRVWYGKVNGRYGGHVRPGVLDITLKPNEEYVRLWGNVGLWLHSPSFSKFGPFHTCGHADELDPVNFKYFEPYEKTHAFCRYCYRYYGNGWLEWKPDGTKGEVKAEAKATTNLEHDTATGLFRVVDAGKPATLVVPVKSPYAVVQVEIDLRVDQPEGAETRISFGPGRGRRVRHRMLTVKSGKASGLVKAVYPNTRSPVYDYEIKVVATGAAAFNVARVKTVFQLNWPSLPSLYPGENTITVSAKAAQKLDANRLLVTYEWADGDGWKNEHADTQAVATLPYTYKLTADVPKDKMPRMKRLVMKLAPKE